MKPIPVQATPAKSVEKNIFLVSNHKVMLDSDLAKLYGVPTKVLVQAVRRNKNRFPGDFMFQLTQQEIANLRSQFVTSSWGGRRYRPYAFTEQGVAMLSSVLKSERAIQVNIAIMRAFVRLRQMVSTHKALTEKLAELEKRIARHDNDVHVIFRSIYELADPSKLEGTVGFSD